MQDPIGLAGGNPTLYGYVYDSNVQVDVFGLNFLQDLANEAANTLKPRTRSAVTVAVGQDDAGNLFVSTSEKRVRTPIREWADSKNITVIDSLQENVHAEQSLVQSNKNIVAIEPSKDVCIDCENLMKENNVKFERSTTGTKSNSRKPGGKYCN